MPLNYKPQSIERLKNQIFEIPLVQHEQILELFGDLEKVAKPMMDLLLDNTEFASACLANVIVEVATGASHGRLLFDKNIYWQEKEVNPKVTEFFRKEHDVVFLEYSANFLDMLTVDTTKYPEIKDLKKEIVSELEFVKLVYEDIVDTYLLLSKDYKDYVLKFVEANSKDHDTMISADFSKLSLLDQALYYIETGCMTSRDLMYPTREILDQLAKRYYKIKARIANPYLRVVFREAKSHATTESQLLDGFQNGSTGLMKAVGCYSRIRATSFASYAKCWVRQTILYHIKTDNNFIKLPSTVWQTNTYLEQVRRKLTAEEGVIDDTRLAKETGYTVEKLSEIRDAVTTSQVYSLDFELDEDNKTRLSDVKGSTKDIDTLETDQHNQVLLLKLDSLPQLHRIVLALSHGLVEALPDRGPIEEQDMLQEVIRQTTCKRE
jgi:DNA-directed RNA polymerase specialized sigma subunit